MGGEPGYQKWFFLTVLLVLVIVACYLRFTYLRTTSPYIDEYTTMWVAQRTLQHGYPVFSTGSIYAQGILFTYLDALFILLLGFSEAVARMPSLIISVCTVACLYWIGRKMFSAHEGLIAAAVLAFGPQAVIWGGRARNYALVQFLLLWAVFFFYRWVIREDRSRYGYLFVLTLVASVFAHNVAMLLFPAFLFCAFLRQGWRWFFRRRVITANMVITAGMATSLYLYRRLRPPGWGEVGEGRPAFGPSFNLLGAVDRYKPFFIGLDDIPFAAVLTALCIVGIGYLLWRALQSRSFRATLSSPSDDGTLAYLGFLLGIVVLEMFFVVSERRWSPRYFFLEAPIFYLIAAHVGVRMVRLAGRRVRERVSFAQSAWTGERLPAGLMGTGLVVLLIGVLSWPAVTSAISKGEYGYDLAFQYVREHRREGDSVMTFALSPCVIYLGESGCDFVTMEKDFHSYAIQRGDIWIEAWAGVPILFTDQALKEVVESGSRTWFVVDETRFRARYTQEFIQYVWDRMELVAKKGGVFVFLAESPPLPPLAIQRSLYYNLEDKVALLGYGLNDDLFEGGDEIRLTLRWRGVTHMLRSYSVSVHLVGAQGTLWAQHDGVPLRGLHPTTHWVAGETIRDPHELELAPNMPSGRYRLEVGLYVPETMEHLAVWDQEMQPQGDRVVVDYVRVVDGAPGPFAPQHSCGFNLGKKVVLRGYDIEPLRAEPGDTVRVVLYWEAQKEMDEEYTVFVHLIDEQGRIWGQKDNQPEGGFFPTSYWDKGDLVRDPYEFSIDPGTPPGLYEIEVGMYVLATGERLPIIGEDGQSVGDRVLLRPVEVVG